MKCSRVNYVLICNSRTFSLSCLASEVTKYASARQTAMTISFNAFTYCFFISSRDPIFFYNTLSILLTCSWSSFNFVQNSLGGTIPASISAVKRCRANITDTWFVRRRWFDFNTSFLWNYLIVKETLIILLK